MSNKTAELIGEAVAVAIAKLYAKVPVPAKPAGPKRLALTAPTIKRLTGATDAARRFSGVATTPTEDLAGDVVIPDGAVYELPIPLLWQHDHTAPVGWVREASIGPSGIRVTCELAKNVGRADEAWQHVETGLTLGLSIGFSPIASEPMPNGGRRFTRWRWHELSICTIPANPDGKITGRKGEGSVKLLRLGSVQLLKGDKK